eukprot:m.201552 g.201552  ORF g.201552 m.201552 type:complete len:753 (-) comp17707_c0_seq2:1672-3930(-)
MASKTMLTVLYDHVGDSNTPALKKGERLVLTKRHDNGWLEFHRETDAAAVGFVPPAWVTEEQVAAPAAATPAPAAAAAAPAPAAAAPTPAPAPAATTGTSSVAALAAQLAAAGIAGAPAPASAPAHAPTPAPSAAAAAAAPAASTDAATVAAGAAAGTDAAAENSTGSSESRPTSSSVAKRTNSLRENQAGVVRREPSASVSTPRKTVQSMSEFSMQLAAKLAGIPLPGGGGAPGAGGDRAPGPPSPTPPTATLATPGVVGQSLSDDDEPNPMSPGIDGRTSFSTAKKKAPPPPPTARPRRTSLADEQLTRRPGADKPALVPSMPLIVADADDKTSAGDDDKDESNTDDVETTIIEPRNAVVLMEGILEKKALIENGKEAKKKGWEKYYATLEGPALCFFKDEKRDKRKSGIKPALLGVLEVDNAYVSETCDLTRKKNAFCIENEQAKVLILAPDEETKVKWMQAIESVRSPTAPTGPPSNSLNVTDTSAPRRFTSASVLPDSLTVTEESVLDGSATPSKKEFGFIRKTLNKYLGMRPAKEDLEKKGIIREPVFGGTIAGQVQREAKAQPTLATENVPLVVSKCIAKVDFFLTEQGIYRLSGNASQIQRLVGKCNEDVFSLDLANEDLHCVTGLLKLYFRELSDPVFTERLYPEFLAAAKISDKDERMKTLKGLILQLPTENQFTLRMLFEHLLRVAAHGDVNKMLCNNLAIVFGPTLLRQSEPPLESIVSDTPYQNSVVEELLREKSYFFG